MDMLQSRESILSNNVKTVLRYLGEQYQCTFDIDEIEQDIVNGYSNLEKEIYNACHTLKIIKNRNKNNFKKVSEANKYLKMLMKEN